MQTLNVNRLWRTLYISGALATLRTEMLNSISTRSTQNKLNNLNLAQKFCNPPDVFNSKESHLPLWAQVNTWSLPDQLPKCSA